jgi:hypothetical protein
MPFPSGLLNAVVLILRSTLVPADFLRVTDVLYHLLVIFSITQECCRFGFSTQIDLPHCLRKSFSHHFKTHLHQAEYQFVLWLVSSTTHVLAVNSESCGMSLFIAASYRKRALCEVIEGFHMPAKSWFKYDVISI